MMAFWLHTGILFFSNDGNASQNKIKAMIMSASKYLLCIAKKIVDDFTVAEYLHIHHFVTFFNLYLNIIRFDYYCPNLHFSSNFQICVFFVNRGKVSFQLESFCAAFEEEHKDPEEYKLFALIADDCTAQCTVFSLEGLISTKMTSFDNVSSSSHYNQVGCSFPGEHFQSAA